MITKNEISGVFLLVLIAGGTALGVNHFSGSGIALIGQWDTSKGVVMAKSKQEVVPGDIEINNPLRVRQMIQNREVILLDVRPKEIYDRGHLPGALSFPVNEFDQNLDRLLAVVPREGAILVYCSGVTCSDSHHFATQLMAAQFTQVRVYAGGFNEWQEMGFEMEKNEE